MHKVPRRALRARPLASRVKNSVSATSYATIPSVTNAQDKADHGAAAAPVAAPSPSAAARRPFFLVLGYGTSWHSGYEHYLDRIAELSKHQAPAWILLCGAPPDGAPGQPSEARWMAEMLEGWGVDRRLMRLEERSRSTFENFLEAAKSGWMPKDRPVVVFCDRCRLFKVRAIVRHLGLLRPRFEALPMEYGWRGVLVRLKSRVDGLRVRLGGPPTR